MTAGIPSHLGGHCNVTHVDRGALAFLVEYLGVRTFLDIGCGPGGMLDEARRLGLEPVGIDGDPRVLRSGIVEHDFTAGREESLGGPFDLGWSVEFLEHVEEMYLPNVLDTIRKCKYLVMTAAPPGKPGYHHVNCQPACYWIEAMQRLGMQVCLTATCWLRQRSTMAREFMRETGLVFAAAASKKAVWTP